MLRKVFFGAVFTLGCIGQAGAFGLTADQMYRNLLMFENKADEATKAQEEPILSFKKAESKPEAMWREKKDLFEKNKQKADEFQPKYSWNDIVVAVKKGNVSPFDLAEIRRQSERENAKAVELLAWMYATGTGLRQDLQKSYTYYLQAVHMGVPTAYDNVRAVYQAMSPAQRAELPSF